MRIEPHKNLSEKGVASQLAAQPALQKSGLYTFGHRQNVLELIRSQSYSPKEPVFVFGYWHICTADIKEASSPFNDTISKVRPVGVEKDFVLREDSDILRCMQNARLPSNARFWAVEKE